MHGYHVKPAVALFAVYAGSVILANWLTTRFGLRPVGFGLTAPAGTIAIGGVIMTRDLLQDAIGRRLIFAAIAAGGIGSWLTSSHQIATASVITFLAAESLEWAVYTPLRKRAALAAQNGLEGMTVPWDTFDVLFIGGDTAWKLGPAARSLAAEALSRGKGVHMGRVNSLRRYRYAESIGCTSVDGTYLTFGPDINLPKLLGWVSDIRGQMTLFGGAA